jgi:hypothetical protein
MGCFILEKCRGRGGMAGDRCGTGGTKAGGHITGKRIQRTGDVYAKQAHGSNAPQGNAGGQKSVLHQRGTPVVLMQSDKDR